MWAIFEVYLNIPQYVKPCEYLIDSFRAYSSQPGI